MQTFGSKVPVAWVLRLAGIAGVLTVLAIGAPALPGLAQNDKEGPRYEAATPGVLVSPGRPLQFRSADVRLEIRDLILGPGPARAVPTPGRALMELRGGSVVTTIDGQKQERRAGDFWVVAKGSALSLENLGAAAVIRSFTIVEGKR